MSIKEDIVETPNLPAVIPRQRDFTAEGSEEVQSIIESMPTCWTKWIALCVGILIGFFILKIDQILIF
ncbi:hypothetical protein [Petrimonas sp.]|uniref:hypothetical protein n=1 Tax=Petrimonas sp. TaxID=2023866 RepID=UPI003F510A3A